MVYAAPIFKPTSTGQQKKLFDRPNAYRRGYGGKKWELMRRRIFRRDNYVCQDCGRICVEGDEDEGRWPHCDHIRPKSQGGGEDVDNLQTMCGRCHNIKTSSEDRIRMRTYE